MDIVGVMAAYLTAVRMCTAESREALPIEYAICSAPSKSAPTLIPRLGTERNYTTEFPLYEIPLHKLLISATRRYQFN